MNLELTDSTARELIKVRGGRVISRESHKLEFKVDFDWDDKRSRIKYLKSIAAFANRNGGFIVFGISDSPRTLQGMSKPFNDIDDADISSLINKYLSPSPLFERREYSTRNGRKIGVMLIHKSDKKPIVCTKSYDTILSESTIYYRYNSKSDKIKAGDLIHLLGEAKELESQKWMSLFSKASTIGIHNIGVFDSERGSISTHKNNQFVLDEKLLKRLKVLDKYSKNEDGAEAVRIVGEIDSSGQVITKSRYLHDNDIISDFLNGKQIDEPEEYLAAMCYQSSGTLPVYYYLRSAGFNIEQALRFLNNVNKNSQAKSKLISRLVDDSTLENSGNNVNIHSGTPIGNSRLELHGRILNEERDHIDIGSLEQTRRTLEAILNLNHGEYNSRFVKDLLSSILDKYYKNQKINHLIRQSVAYLDFIENRP